MEKNQKRKKKIKKNKKQYEQISYWRKGENV